MTSEEAIHFAECLKHNYTINFADMEVFCDMAIKALEQEPILDKIRAEIKDWQTDIHDNEYDAESHDFVFERIYEIIDEHKAESEVVNENSN